jgi:tetratricopeptide (TPR) repeat protein
MSRFNNLEFGDQNNEHEQTRSVVKDGSYYLKEAQVAFSGGRFEQALRSYAKVLEFEPNSASAWIGQVRMLIELGEFQEAKLWADKALEKFPEEPDLLAAKAVALARVGDLKAALLPMRRKRGATHPMCGWPAVMCWLARKERRAEFCFDKALGLAAKDWMMHWLVCRVYYFYKQFSRAFKFAQQALELNAAQAVLWLQFGQCQMALGLVGAAANSFEQAQQLDPECRPSAEQRLEWAEAGFWAKLRGQWRRIFQG